MSIAQRARLVAALGLLNVALVLVALAIGTSNTGYVPGTRPAGTTTVDLPSQGATPAAPTTTPLTAGGGGVTQPAASTPAASLEPSPAATPTADVTPIPGSPAPTATPGPGRVGPTSSTPGTGEEPAPVPPSVVPTAVPTAAATASPPTVQPSQIVARPTRFPTPTPSVAPSVGPSATPAPSLRPTAPPVVRPTTVPTPAPTMPSASHRGRPSCPVPGSGAGHAKTERPASPPCRPVSAAWHHGSPVRSAPTERGQAKGHGHGNAKGGFVLLLPGLVPGLEAARRRLRSLRSRATR